MPTFDLLTEPWIPVVTDRRETQHMGLRDVLHLAPQLTEIRDPLPTVEFGLYRLLVALVMDIHGLGELTDLEDLLAAGRFDEAGTDRYFAACGDRFDLFHPVHPFLQTPGMAAKDERPLAALVPVVPSGVNAVHFHHYHEDSFCASPAAAARLLTTLAPFMTAGGPGLSPSINGAPPWYVLLLGGTLFETLCLNCCVVPVSTASGDAPPAWRNDTPAPRERALRASLLEALTWRPRRVQLLPGGPGRCSLTGATTDQVVNRMRFARGASCGFTWRDPSVAYRIEARNVAPLRPREGHALWRDTGPLALLCEANHGAARGRTTVRFERPALVSQFAAMVRSGRLGRRAELRVTAYGLRTDLRMKVFEWQRESLSLPAPLLWRSAFRAAAQQAMEEAESAAAALRHAVRIAFPRQAKRKAAIASRAGATEGRFWFALRPHYDGLLRAFVNSPDAPAGTGRGGCCCRWRECLRATAQQALDGAIGHLDVDADALARQVKARALLRLRLGQFAAVDTIANEGDTP